MKYLPVAHASLLLMACDAGQRAAAPLLEPGAWEVSSEVVYPEPPDAYLVYKGSPPPPAPPRLPSRACLTSRQASRPSAPFVLTGFDDCDFDNVSMVDGRIGGHFTCHDITHRVIEGRFSRTGFQARTRFDSDVEKLAAISELHISARRVGDC